MLKRTIGVAMTAATLLMAGATPGLADWGGVPGVNAAGCTDGYTVKSVPITDWLGRTVGSLQIRWSDICYAQWARITSSGVAEHLAASLHENSHPSNAAGSDDYNTNLSWTPVIALLGGSSSSVCAYGDIYNLNGINHSSAVVCA